MTKLIYCATPSRLSHKTCEIMNFVSKQGYGPLHPFQALPYERFEGNPLIGREKSMEFCLRLIDISDEFWMFGVSSGTLDEVTYASSIIPVRLHFQFDSEWKKHYDILGPDYVNVLDSQLRNI